MSDSLAKLTQADVEVIAQSVATMNRIIRRAVKQTGDPTAQALLPLMMVTRDNVVNELRRFAVMATAIPVFRADHK